jgi:phage shock protein A
MAILDRLQLLIRSEVQPRSRGGRDASPDERRAVLRDVRDSLARLYAAERQVMSGYQDQLDEVQAWEDRAAIAVRAGKDDLGREALQRKRALELRAESTRKELDRIQREIVQLRDGVDRLRDAAGRAPQAPAAGRWEDSGSRVSPPPAAGRWDRAPAGPTTHQTPIATAPPAPGPVSPWAQPAVSPWAAPAPSTESASGPLEPIGAAYPAAAPTPPTYSPANPWGTPSAATPHHSGSLASSASASAARAEATIEGVRHRMTDFGPMESRISALEAEVEARSMLADDLEDPLRDPHAASFDALERQARARDIEARVASMRDEVERTPPPATDHPSDGDDPIEKLRRRLGGG